MQAKVVDVGPQEAVIQLGSYKEAIMGGYKLVILFIVNQ